MRARYRTLARALLAPRDLLLPAFGASLSGHPRLAATILLALRRLPGRRLRIAAHRRLSRPLVQRMRARIVIPVFGGRRMMVDTSDVLGRTLATSGVWEPHLTATFQSLVSSGDVVVDAGANIGYYTLLASDLVRPDGRVYALEPAPATYAELCSNLALNEVSNVTALCVAAGAGDGDAILYDGPPGHSGIAAIGRPPGPPRAQTRLDPSTRTVAVRSIASVVESSEVGKVGVVKIDVEGYEVEVLRGLEPIFERGGRPTLLVELHDECVEDAAVVLSHLADEFGMQAFELFDDDRLDRFSPETLVSPELSSRLDLGSIRNGRRHDILLVPLPPPSGTEASSPGTTGPKQRT